MMTRHYLKWSCAVPPSIFLGVAGTQHNTQALTHLVDLCLLATGGGLGKVHVGDVLVHGGEVNLREGETSETEIKEEDEEEETKEEEEINNRQQMK